MNQLRGTICVLTGLAGVAACGDGNAPQPQTPAEALVLRQVEAYNAHDIEAFAAFYDDRVELFNLPDSSAFSRGKASLRSNFAETFEEGKPSCEIAGHISAGSFVTVRENCTFAKTGTRKFLVTYQVEDGLIRRVWFATAPGADSTAD